MDVSGLENYTYSMRFSKAMNAPRMVSQMSQNIYIYSLINTIKILFRREIMNKTNIS